MEKTTRTAREADTGNSVSSGPKIILHLEDEPNKTGKINRAIINDVANALVSVANSKEAFRASLENPALGLIVADDGVEGFSCLEALAIAKELRPDVPFVVVSDMLSTSKGRQAVTEGADDHIRKEELWRLGPIVQNALFDGSITNSQETIDRHKTASEVLVAAITQLVQVDSTEEIGAIIVKAARNLTGADGATLVMKEGNQCYYIDEDAISPLFKGQRLPLNSRICGWCIRNKQQVSTPDVYADDRISAEDYRPTFVKSLAVAPVGKAEPLAAIAAYWATRHQPTTEELRQLQLLADSTALAIEGANQRNDSRMRIERLQAQRRCLVKIARSPLVTCGDVEGMVRFATEQAALVTGADRASVWAVDDPRESFICKDVYEPSSGEHLAFEFAIVRAEYPEYFSRFDTDQYAVLVEGTTDEANKAVVQDFLVLNGAKSALAVRIMTDDGLGGILSINSANAREWEDDEIRFALALASQIRITMATDERRKAEESLAEMNVHLDQLVQERTQELEIANRELDAFARTLSHDLKNPVAVIETSCWLMRDQCQLPEDSLKPLTRIESAAKRMKVQIASMLQLYHLSQEEIIREPCDLTAMARDIAEDLVTGQSANHIEFTIQENMLDKASPDLFRSALVNLLSNAFKYSSKCARQHIEFGMTPADGDVSTVYHVRDNGVGFDMANADKLFGLFQRFHSASQFEGTGVGLASARRIIQNHGGRVWAESKPNEGATFYFTLCGDRG
ncbi:MAG: ATP-binding protein [Verrucomicrobiales bacterium]